MKQKKILSGLLLLVFLLLVAFFAFRENWQVILPIKDVSSSRLNTASSRTSTGETKLKSSRSTSKAKQSVDSWQWVDSWEAWVDRATEQSMKFILEQTQADPMSAQELAARRASFRANFEAQVQDWKEAGFTKPPASIPKLVNFERGESAVTVIESEKYTGNQTVEAVMEAFDDMYDRGHTDVIAEVDLDEKYPRAEWLAMFLDKGVMVGDYSDYTFYMGLRSNLARFERDGDWVLGTQGVSPTNDWETFKAAYIDRKAWEFQQIYAARQADPSVIGGTFMGPDDRTFLPYSEGRVYVQREERGASFFGEILTDKQRWDIMLQGKHPEGYEIVYVDENGTILSEPPPPIPPPAGEERRQLEAWLKRGEGQRTSDVPDRTFEDLDDWDSGEQDRLSGDETVNAEAQTAQKQFERAQTEAFERVTKSDAEIEADLKKQLTPEPPTAAGIETQLSERFSPERLQKAREVLERYGPEEGMRRLREDDAEVAAQFERTRRDRNPAESETEESENPTR